MIKPCTRFRADGNPCPNSTNRADGWCGKCDGYARANATSLREGDDVAKMGRWFSSERNWKKAKPPIEADEIQDVSVSAKAVAWFAQHHGTTQPEAEAQIRSLLEDCLLGGSTMCNAKGFWRMQTAGHGSAASGYGLGLSPDCDRIISYHTRHRERTYAQVRAGIKSRVSEKPEKRRVKKLLGTAAGQLQEAVKDFDGERFSQELFDKVGIPKENRE